VVESARSCEPAGVTADAAQSRRFVLLRMTVRRRLPFVFVAAALLAGCASRSVDVKPWPTSVADFAAWPCEAIDDEAERVQQRAAEVAYAVDALHGNNVIVFTLGTTVFWPALLAMRPDGPDAEALARLKGRYEALAEASARRGCPPASELLPPSRAAALPVAVGERLVYEDRAGAGRTLQVTLRVTALKRGELDFVLEHPGQRAALPWRQDAAGNNADARGEGLLTWSRLLRRDLMLGDVLAGEMHSADAEEAVARVRGQVIAVGPTQVSGRSFDAATIELFGDAPSGLNRTRLDGVMVVDRASGLLLRLELRSGNPDYAVRRRLLRIE
jgi:hypothetical protein